MWPRRVVRGGSWGFDRSGARAADRSNLAPVARGSSIGFRVARASLI